MRRGKGVRLMIAAVAVGVVVTACSSDSTSSGQTAAGSPSRAAQETGPVTLKVLAFNDYMPEDIPKQFKELTGNDMEITYNGFCEMDSFIMGNPGEVATIYSDTDCDGIPDTR